MTEETWMRRALDLARRGRGFVEPNPAVGAVLVREGKVVGEGWHRRFGGPHAEVEGIRAAGESARGATLYVTLDPCSRHGKTPPCTDAIVEAGIAEVIAAMEDPNPHERGGGAGILREAGVPVRTGLLEAEARRLNEAYLKRIMTGRPWVELKWGMSLDGRIADRSGKGRWITGEASRREVHEGRGIADGVLVGVGTVLADDPDLSARIDNPPRRAVRVVVDSAARTPLDCNLVRTAREWPVLVAVGPEGPVDRCDALAAAGCEVWRSPGPGPRVHLAVLLDEFGRRGWTRVWVESAGRVAASLLAEGLVDRVRLYLGPKLLGGTAGPVPVDGVLPEGMRLDDVSVRTVGEDVCLEGYPVSPGTSR